MTITAATSRRRVPGRPLKSPLAVAGGYRSSETGPAVDADPALAGAVLSDREATLAEFEDYLRTVNSREGRPYEEKTISTYVGPAKNLDRWMTASEITGDFTVADTALLNRYFREYYLEHGQSGTHTLQRNLIQLFNFLEHEHGFASPYSGEGLNRYAPVKEHPKTLSAGFVDDLLEVTGGGRARDFENARDHAMIRILRSEGIRRAEVLGMVMHTLPADVIRNPTFRLVPLKGARAAGEGRHVLRSIPGSLLHDGIVHARQLWLACWTSAPPDICGFEGLGVQVRCDSTALSTAAWVCAIMYRSSGTR